MIVVSGIIGSGIFVNPYLVAQWVKTPSLILGVWVAGGAIALAGAFVFAELATVVPRVGGQYAFFREAFHPGVAFLHGWALLWIIQTGATAAVAVAFAEYLVRLAGWSQGLVPLLGASVLVLLAAFHALGIRPGAVLINVVTFAKTAVLAGVVIGAIFLVAPAPLAWTPIAPMSARRVGHTATRLPDGRLLVAGGMGNHLAGRGDLVVWDPATDAWTPFGDGLLGYSRQANF